MLATTKRTASDVVMNVFIGIMIILLLAFIYASLSGLPFLAGLRPVSDMGALMVTLVFGLGGMITVLALCGVMKSVWMERSLRSKHSQPHNGSPYSTK